MYKGEMDDLALSRAERPFFELLVSDEADRRLTKKTQTPGLWETVIGKFEPFVHIVVSSCEQVIRIERKRL